MTNAIRNAWTVLALALSVVVLLPACSSQRQIAPKAEDASIVVRRDVPRVLEGTVGTMATLEGMSPEIVSGYGLVVGLNGTGSTQVPLGVRALMEREMLRQGVGRELTVFANITPDQMLDDPNTAVVFVQALMPPGAPNGAIFDVRVSAIPGTGTLSLQGGRLYTCELRRGVADPSAPDTPAVALARGPIFINPFSDPGVTDDDDIVKTRGRVLGGGTVITPYRPTLRLDTPSHARAQQVVRAINGRFTRSGYRDSVARGMSEELIAITIPRNYRNDTTTFIDLLSHTQVNTIAPAEYANLYVNALRDQPSLADDLAWALQAMGEPVIPAVRDLYNEPQIVPRMTALQVGARLGDAATAPHLKEIVQNATREPDAEGARQIGERNGAIRLLGILPPAPQINLFLRGLLNHDDISVRVAAYRSLVERADVSIRRVRATGFEVHVVPSTKPLIFFRQTETPLIVIFGDRLELNRPLLVSAWDTPVPGSVDLQGRDLRVDRLVITSNSPGADSVDVLYRDYRTGERMRTRAPADLLDFILFCAHDPSPESPEPGLSLGYSEVVGALAAIIDQKGLDAQLVPERDARDAEFLRRIQEAEPADRPEFASGAIESDLFIPLVDPPADLDTPGPATYEPEDKEVGPYLKAPGSAERPER